MNFLRFLDGFKKLNSWSFQLICWFLRWLLWHSSLILRFTFCISIHLLHSLTFPPPPFMLIVGSWLIYLYIIPCIRMRICAACAWRIQIFVGDLLYREWIQHNELQAMYAVLWLWSFMLSINEMIQFIIGWKFRFPSWLLSFGSDFWDVTYSRLYILVNQCLSLPYFFLISCV